MIKKQLFPLIVFFFLLTCQSYAQELNFTVKVVTNPGQGRIADPKVFSSLETAIKELINNTKWTDDIYEQNERIVGSIQLTIKSEASTTGFTGELAIQASRPVYGTDYTTPIFTHLDRDVQFSYEQFQPLQFVKNSFGDNLTASLAYYVYVILGMDYDSFSPQGGEQFWQLAQDIYNTVPSSAKGEWQGKELGNKNRYWFVENFLSPRLKNFRQGIYEYHRLGLDAASTDVNRCKAAIMQCLERLDEAHQAYPNTLAVRSFSVTKGDEMINILKNGTDEQKAQFVQIMVKLDPANGAKYERVYNR
jgi:Domain of unknown function (DUF4835)